MPDKPLEGQVTSEDISILWGEGKVGRRQRREKGGKGESDCEDGRGCREAIGIGSLHWFLVWTGC